MLRPIKNKKQHAEALERAYELMQKKLKPGSAESDELEVLSMLIAGYEERQYPIPPPHPIDAIKFRLDQLGLTPADLQPILGYRSRVSEILRGKRKLTLEMVRNLNSELHIPLESLIVRY